MLVNSTRALKCTDFSVLSLLGCLCLVLLMDTSDASSTKTCSNLVAEASCGVTDGSSLTAREGYVSLHFVSSLSPSATIIPDEEIRLLEQTFKEMYQCAQTELGGTTNKEPVVYYRKLEHFCVLQDTLQVYPHASLEIFGFHKNATFSGERLHVVSMLAQYRMESNLCPMQLFHPRRIASGRERRLRNSSNNLKWGRPIEKDRNFRSRVAEVFTEPRNRMVRRQLQGAGEESPPILERCFCEYPTASAFIEGLYNRSIHDKYLKGNFTRIVGAVSAMEVEPSTQSHCPAPPEELCSAANSSTNTTQDNNLHSDLNQTQDDPITFEKSAITSVSFKPWKAAAVLVVEVPDFTLIQANTTSWLRSLESGFRNSYNQLNSKLHGASNFCDPYSRTIQDVNASILSFFLNPNASTTTRPPSSANNTQPSHRRLRLEQISSTVPKTSSQTDRPSYAPTNSPSQLVADTTSQAPTIRGPALVELLFVAEGLCDGCPPDIGFFNDTINSIDDVLVGGEMRSIESSNYTSSSLSSCFCPLDAKNRSIDDDEFLLYLSSEAVEFGDSIIKPTVRNFIEVDCASCSLQTFKTTSNMLFTGFPELITEKVLNVCGLIFIETYNSLSTEYCHPQSIRLSRADVAMVGFDLNSQDSRMLQNGNEGNEGGDDALNGTLLSTSVPSSEPSAQKPILFEMEFDITGVCEDCPQGTELFDDVARRLTTSEIQNIMFTVTKTKPHRGLKTLQRDNGLLCVVDDDQSEEVTPNAEEFERLFEEEALSREWDGLVSLEEVIQTSVGDCAVGGCEIEIPSFFAANLALEMMADPTVLFTEDTLFSILEESFLEVYNCDHALRNVTSIWFGRNEPPSIIFSEETDADPSFLLLLHVDVTSYTCQEDLFAVSPEFRKLSEINLVADSSYLRADYTKHQRALEMEQCECKIFSQEEFLLLYSNLIKTKEVGLDVVDMWVENATDTVSFDDGT